MKRSGALKRRTELARRGALRLVSPKRRRRYAAAVDGKDEVRARSGGRCELRFSRYCTGAATSFHHVIKQSQGGPDTADNLLHSCWFCNEDVEHRPLEAQAAGISKRRNYTTHEVAT